MQNILTILLFLGLMITIVLEYVLIIYSNKKSQFRKLIRLNRTEETNFKEFNHYYSVIKNKFNLEYFEIVYWKNGSTIIKINKDYYDVFPTGMNLIFNEDEHLTTEFEEYCNQ